MDGVGGRVNGSPLTLLSGTKPPADEASRLILVASSAWQDVTLSCRQYHEQKNSTMTASVNDDHVETAILIIM